MLYRNEASRYTYYYVLSLYLSHLCGLFTESMLLLGATGLMMGLAILQVVFFLRAFHSVFVSILAVLLFLL